MSAILCGKRSFFEDLTVTTPPVSKRIRSSSSSSSPVHFFAPSTALLIDQLSSLFPHMDKQLLERALEDCGNDLDSAIKSLNELRLGSADNNLGNDVAAINVSQEANGPEQGVPTSNAEVPQADDHSIPIHLQMGGADWVELFVSEMMSASNIDDARARASWSLEVLEKSIYARAELQTAQSHQENMMLKEQLQGLLQENSILKRAVAIQHERQKEYEGSSQELQHLKQLISQHQEQLRTLEINNYALTLHLKQAQQSSSIPGQFNPDVF